MIYLLSTMVGLLVVVVAATASLLYLATRDVASIEDDGSEDDDDDGDGPDLLADVEPYVSFLPPFRILYLGESGEHDMYPPFTQELRESYVDYLEASWSLPAREPGATL